MREVMDEATGISNQVVVDWKQQAKGAELKPRVTLRDEAGEVINLPNGAGGALLHVGRRHPVGRERPAVKAGDVLARIPLESSKTRDITGGLPRVAELFEARKAEGLRDHRRIRRPRRVRQGLQDQAPDRRCPDGGRGSDEYLVPKGKHITVQEGDFVSRARC